MQKAGSPIGGCHRHKHASRKGHKFVLSGVGVLFACAIASCGSSAAATIPTSTVTARATPQPAPTPVPTADINAVTSGVLNAYNLYYVTDYNIDIKKQTKWGIGTQQLKDAINHEVVDGQAFDRVIGALDTQGLPAVAADVTAVIAADAALENAEGTLAVNTDSLVNYDSIFSIEQTAQGAFTAAVATLDRALGIT